MAGKVKVDIDWNRWRMEYAKEKPPNMKKWCQDKPFSYDQCKNNIRKKDMDKYEKLLDRRMAVDEFLSRSDAVNPIKNSRAMISVLQECFALNYKDVLIDNTLDELISTADNGRVFLDPKFAALKELGYWLMQEKKIINEQAKTLHDTQKLETIVAKIIEILSVNASAEQIDQVRELFAQLKSPVSDAYSDEDY